MRLSAEQLERLAERVFKVLKASPHVAFDYGVDEMVEDRVIDSIAGTLEDDTKMEDRLSREAERLVNQQSQIAKASGRSLDDLVADVKERLARSKRVVLGDGPERADTLGEKIFKNIWKIDGIDFFSDDRKVQNCIARALYRFRLEDDRIIEALENLTSKKTEAEPYSAEWCKLYDKHLNELRQKLTENHKAGAGSSASAAESPA